MKSLSSTYSKNGCTTCWACAFYCRFTIFHGVWCWTADFSFVSTLYTISNCHNCFRRVVILARSCRTFFTIRQTSDLIFSVPELPFSYRIFNLFLFSKFYSIIIPSFRIKLLNKFCVLFIYSSFDYIS